MTPKSIFVYLLLSIASTKAFVAPAAFLKRREAPSSAFHALPIPPSLDDLPFFSLLLLLSSQLEPIVDRTDIVSDLDLETAQNFVDEAGEGLKNIAFSIVAVAAAVTLITTAFVSFIIPKAAQELETQVKETYPELWTEYSAKLEEGETLVMRPDIMQELGEKVQKRMEEEFEDEAAKQAAAEQEQEGEVNPNDTNVIDVEVVKEEDDEP
jgi:hypothetical protein